MSHRPDRLSQMVFILASVLYFGAVDLRTLLTYRYSSIFPQVLLILSLVTILYLSEAYIFRRIPRSFFVYLVVQTGLVFLLMNTPDNSDFFGVLFNVLSMQVMLRLDPRWGGAWMVSCAAGMVWMLNQTYDLFSAVALSLVYTAGNVFLGTYTLATRRAHAARERNQALAVELQDANHQLQAYTSQLKHLAIARERSRLARELHDSVTQTVFSMTLVIQAASITLTRDPAKVEDHLERLSLLSRSALSEMQMLVAQLNPDGAAGEGLVVALQRHLSSTRIPPELSVSLELEGSLSLSATEEQGLFRIVEEALNNVVKHSCATKAFLRLHLLEPLWMEVEDQGQGFDLAQARGGGRIGLASMQERAAEIGWDFQIYSTPGSGTRIRVEKLPVREVLG